MPQFPFGPSVTSRPYWLSAVVSCIARTTGAAHRIERDRAELPQRAGQHGVGNVPGQDGGRFHEGAAPIMFMVTRWNMLSNGIG